MSPKQQIHNKANISFVAEHLKEIVYGGNDGIITTFAIIAGFTRAQGSISGSVYPLLTVLLFGIANLFAGGFSMGLGNFISMRSEKDLYQIEKQRKLDKIKKRSATEKSRTIALLLERGFDREQANQLVKLYSQNEDYWAEFMVKYEFGMPDPKSENPYSTATATFSAFITFGFIPLIPYTFLRGMNNLFFLSGLFTFGALILLGLLRWKITKDPLIRAVGESILVGGIAAMIAYSVGTFFHLK